MRADDGQITEVQTLLKEIKEINRRTQIENTLMALRRLRGSYKSKE